MSRGNGTDRALQRLLDQLPAPEDGLEFTSLLDALYAVRFTGPLTLDFLNGRPRQIHLGQPLRLAIVRGGLDKPETPGTG